MAANAPQRTYTLGLGDGNRLRVFSSWEQRLKEVKAKYAHMHKNLVSLTRGYGSPDFKTLSDLHSQVKENQRLFEEMSEKQEKQKQALIADATRLQLEFGSIKPGDIPQSERVPVFHGRVLELAITVICKQPGGLEKLFEAKPEFKKWVTSAIDASRLARIHELETQVVVPDSQPIRQNDSNALKELKQKHLEELAAVQREFASLNTKLTTLQTTYDRLQDNYSVVTENSGTANRQLREERSHVDKLSANLQKAELSEKSIRDHNSKLQTDLDEERKICQQLNEINLGLHCQRNSNETFNQQIEQLLTDITNQKKFICTQTPLENIRAQILNFQKSEQGYIRECSPTVFDLLDNLWLNEVGQLERLQANFNALQGNYKTKTQELAAKSALYDSLKASSEDTTQKYLKFLTDHNNCSEKLGSLELQVNELKQKQDENQNQIQSYQGEISTLNSDKARLDSNIKNNSVKFEDLNKKKSAVDKKLTTALSKITELEKECSKFKADALKTGDRVKNAERQESSARKDADILQREIDGLNRKLNEESVKIEDFRARAIRAETQVSLYETETSVAKSQLDASNGKVLSLEQTNNSAQRELETFRVSLQALQQEKNGCDLSIQTVRNRLPALISQLLPDCDHSKNADFKNLIASLAFDNSVVTQRYEKPITYWAMSCYYEGALLESSKIQTPMAAIFWLYTQVDFQLPGTFEFECINYLISQIPTHWDSILACILYETCVKLVRSLSNMPQGATWCEKSTLLALALLQLCECLDRYWVLNELSAHIRILKEYINRSSAKLLAILHDSLTLNDNHVNRVLAEEYNQIIDYLVGKLGTDCVAYSNLVMLSVIESDYILIILPEEPLIHLVEKKHITRDESKWILPPINLSTSLPDIFVYSEVLWWDTMINSDNAPNPPNTEEMEALLKESLMEWQLDGSIEDV